MSANDTVKVIFRTTLGESHHTEEMIWDFFEMSDVWLRYDSSGNVEFPSTWDEVVLAVLDTCRLALTQRMRQPAVFRGDE